MDHWPGSLDPPSPWMPGRRKRAGDHGARRSPTAQPGNGTSVKRPDHNLVVDCLRGFSILLVLGIHFFGLHVRLNERAETFANPLYRLFGHGYFGVTIFFVISGYLITITSLERKGDGIALDIPRFYARRVSRIAPLLILALAIGIVVLNTGTPGDRAFDFVVNTSSDVHTAPFWLSIAFFQYNWFKIYSAFQGRYSGLQWDILWSLAVEEQFYLIFPLLVAALKTVRRLRHVMVGAVVFAFLSRLVLQVTLGKSVLAGNATFTCFDALAIGVLVGIAKPWAVQEARRAALAVPVLFVIGYAVGSEAVGGVFVTVVAKAAGLLIQATRSLDLRAVLPRLWLLADLGRLSYGAYLLHPVIFLALAPFVASGRHDAMLGFVVAVVTTYGVAKLSFRLYERPVERWSRAALYAAIERRRGERSSVASPGGVSEARADPLNG